VFWSFLSSEVDSSPDFVEPRFCRQKWASKSFWAPKFERFAKIIRALPWSDPEGAKALSSLLVARIAFSIKNWRRWFGMWDGQACLGSASGWVMELLETGPSFRLDVY
jgi:hypothetical protein